MRDIRTHTYVHTQYTSAEVSTRNLVARWLDTMDGNLARLTLCSLHSRVARGAPAYIGNPSTMNVPNQR